MVNIVNSKTQAFLEYIVVLILAGVVTFGPNIAGIIGTIIPPGSQLAPAVPYIIWALVTTATFIAYEFLSLEGLAWFKAILGKMEKQPNNKNNDKGSMSLYAYVILGVIVLIGLATITIMVIFKIDPVSITIGLLSGLTLWVASILFKRSTVKSYPGVVIFKDTNGVERACINLDEYDAEKNSISADIPEGCLYIVVTKGGIILNANESQAQFNPKDGKCYGFPDWWRDEIPEDPNAVFLEMCRQANGAERLKYILNKIAGKGKDIVYLKCVLILGQAEVDIMKSGKAGLAAYDDFVLDRNPAPHNLTTGWTIHLKHDDDMLKREADKLYWNVYKKD